VNALDQIAPLSAERHSEIKKRHERAVTLAESLPPVIDDWENGDGFITGPEVLDLFCETRMGKDAGEFTFALHAYFDVADLLAEVDRLNKVVEFLGDVLHGVGGLSLPPEPAVQPDPQGGA
jgi:hypothetical protein